jgi:Regulator of chromosome condensation (RCC1) repeat
MSGQRSADDEGAAESVAAGCNMREGPVHRHRRDNMMLISNNGSSSNNNTASVVTGDNRTGNSNNNHGKYCLAVFTFGRGEDGQLGHGDTADQDEPTYVSFFVRTCLLFAMFYYVQYCEKFKLIVLCISISYSTYCNMMIIIQ